MNGTDRKRPLPLASFVALLSAVVAVISLAGALDPWAALAVIALLIAVVARLARVQRRAALRAMLALDPCQISTLTPESLGIAMSQLAKEQIGGDDPFPPYVHRGPEDDRIRSRLKKHRMVIVVGNRYAGKTRAALEAIGRGNRAEMLVLRRSFDHDNPLRTILTAPWLIPRSSRCFLFVDKLDTYLDGIEQHDIDAWLEAHPKAALVATISSRALDDALDANSPDYHHNKQILDRGKRALVADRIERGPLERAKEIYGDDPELVRLGSYLGGGPAVEERYVDAFTQSKAAWAVTTAAIAAARAGSLHGIRRDDLLRLTHQLGLAQGMATEELAEAIEICRDEPEGIMGMLVAEPSVDGEELLRANSILLREDPEASTERRGAQMSQATWTAVAEILGEDQASCVAIARAAFLHATRQSPTDVQLMELALELLWSEAAERNPRPKPEREAMSLATRLIDELERDDTPRPLDPPKPLPEPERDMVNEVIERRGVRRDDGPFEPALPAYWKPPPFYTRRWLRDGLRFAVLLTSDLLAIATGIALGAAFSNEVIGEVEPFASVARGAGVAFPLLVVLFAYLGLYRPDAKRAQLPEIVNGMAIAAFALVLMAMAKGVEPPALALILSSAVAASAAVFFLRAAYDFVSGRWVDWRGLPARTLIVSPAASARVSADLIRNTSRRPMQFVGFVSSQEADDPAQLSTLAEFEQVLSELFVDHVILADPGLPITARSQLAAICHARGVRVELFPSPREITQEAGEALSDLTVPLIEVPPPYLSPFNARVKRSFDLVLGTGLCILGFVPLAAMTVVLLLLGLGRWPIVGLPRLGRKRVRFSMYRFRLNRHSAFAGWVNGLLRRTHFDELPQLYNVLHGEMSLVGPRPLTAREYGELDDVQSQRYAIKPGITGLWQVAHRGGPVHDESARMALMARMDLVYCRRWSPLLDFTILLRTPGAVLRSSEREPEDSHATWEAQASAGRQDSSIGRTHPDASSRPAL